MSEAIKRLDAQISELPFSSVARLSHAERCGAFFALHRGFPKSLVARAFGITPSTAGLLADCLSHEPKAANRARYAKVAEAFRTLGEERFGELYYTSDIDARLARVRVGAPSDGDKTRRGFGASQTYDVAQGLWWISTINNDDALVLIHWLDGEGWTFSEANIPAFEDNLLKLEWTASRRFKSSLTALKQAHLSYDQDPPLTVQHANKCQIDFRNLRRVA